MIWLILALLSAFFDGIGDLINRFIMIKQNAIAYAFVWHILAAIFYIPFIGKINLPNIPFAWFVLVSASILWALAGFTGFLAYKYTEASVKVPLGKSRLLFLLVFSVIFLKESITLLKVVGTFLIFFGVIILTYKNKKVFGKLSDRGVQLTLLTALLIALVSILDKVAIKYFSVGLYGFLVYLIPGSLIGLFAFNKTKEIKKLIKERALVVLISAILGFLFYYLRLKAYSLEEVSKVFPITQLSTLVVVFGGIFILREKTDIFKKILSAIIMILGAILISIRI